MLPPTFHIQRRIAGSRVKGFDEWHVQQGHYTTLKAAQFGVRDHVMPGFDVRIVRVDRTETVVFGTGLEERCNPAPVPDPVPAPAPEHYDGAMVKFGARRAIFFPMTERNEQRLRDKGYRKLARGRFTHWVRNLEKKKAVHL